MTISLFSFATYADDSNYIGFNLSSMVFKENSSENFDISATSLVFGTSINDNLSTEIRYGIGIFKDANKIEAEDISIEVDRVYGLYFKYAVEVNGYYPYIVFGHSEGTFKATAGDDTAEATYPSFSYGVGLRLGETEASSFNLEYMRLFDNEEANTIVNGFSLGFKLGF